MKTTREVFAEWFTSNEMADMELESVMARLAEVSGLCGLELTDVQRELLTAQSALTRARGLLQRQPNRKDVTQ
jgi:hypothetical protein